MSIQLLIDSLKKKGVQVFGPEKLTTYVWFTDGTRIGYAQYNNFDGAKFSTVNKPCKECGTGFQAKDAQDALSFAPAWAGSSRDFVVKYKDFAEFKAKNWQPLVEY